MKTYRVQYLTWLDTISEFDMKADSDFEIFTKANNRLEFDKTLKELLKIEQLLMVWSV